MTDLESMLLRIGNEQEAANGQPFAFQCEDSESRLVEELRARGFVRQKWAGRGPSIVRMIDGYTLFNALCLTDDGCDLWRSLTAPRFDP